jgi:hypothetical protein
MEVKKLAENPQTRLRELLVDPDTFATVLITIIVDAYGAAALDWTAETIRMQLWDDFAVEIPSGGLDKIMAAITLLTTNYFYVNLPRFITLCNALAGSLSVDEVGVADSFDCAWGITEALLLDPPEESEPFCDDIRNYIGAVLKDEGYVQPPDVLKIALNGDFAQQVQYDWSDDPVMFSAALENRETKTTELTDMLRENLLELLEQLKALPLKNGNVQRFMDRLPADWKSR